MSLFARHWSWIAAALLVGGGCSTFDVAEREIETVGERSEGGPANQPASLDADALAVTEADKNAEPVVVRATDDAARSEAAQGYRSANEPGRFDRGLQDPAEVAGNDPRRELASAVQAEANQTETFDQLMAEARRRGALTAAEEASFRRDLADVPGHLRPQMAAMLLAMRGRREEPSATAAATSVATQPLAPFDQVNGAANSPAKQSVTIGATTADRLAQITAVSAPSGASSLDDNPLRALVQAETAARQTAARQAATGAAGTQVAGPRVGGAASASNVPGEVSSSSVNSQSKLAWPNSIAPAKQANSSALDIAMETRPPSLPSRRAADEPMHEEWQVMLAATIRSLEGKLAEAPDDAESTRRKALLRLLYLAANRLEDSAKAMPADASEQQFWIDWLYGTSVYLDDAATPNDGQRAAIAAERLRDAVQRLGEQANLLVSNVAFCRRVTSFGVYEAFGAKPGAAANEFTANQEVLLYAEVRNFTSVPTAKGHHTLLRPSYQIFDAQGRRLGSVVELDESHDYCQRPRTDFFVCYHIYLPTRIDPGEYKLKLTIEDVHGGKVHENSVDFSIKRG